MCLFMRRTLRHERLPGALCYSCSYYGQHSPWLLGACLDGEGCLHDDSTYVCRHGRGYGCLHMGGRRQVVINVNK